MTRKYSGEYKKYQPYVVEDIRKVVGAVGGSATGGSGMQVHTLSGPYHSGELAQSQASWAATKVELSNHAALPDVHHAKLHAITDAANHSVTGSQYQIVGLTAVNTLGLLTPSATPAANAVVKTDGSSGVTLVDLTVTSDLFMSGYLDFGTDVMYEDASYLQVTGSKAVRFGQNIGNAAWTIYNAGGAQFGGNVDIVSGGDLTVGSNVLFVDNSLANVGINMAPDPQFALDVNGPARATYFIGPHAIQLKDVLMLCHYDGRQPFETNYTGELNGHMGQVCTPYGGAIFRPGKFGSKAVQVAEATTNYCPNPSAETDAVGWTQEYNGGTLTFQARTQEQYLYGLWSVKMQASAASTYVFNSPHFHGPASSGMTWNNTETATISCYVKGSGVWRVVFEDAGQNLRAFQQVTLTDDWQRVVLTSTNSSGNNYASIRASFFPWSASCTLYVDGVQYEKLAYATPYCDGSLGGYSTAGVPDGSGHSWVGTAHASASSRVLSYLAYPTAGNITLSKWSVMAWVNPSNVNGSGQTVWRVGGSTGNFILRLSSTNKVEAFAGTASVIGTSTIPAGSWTHLAATYDGTTLRVYVNGQLENSGASSGFTGMSSVMYVGAYGASVYFNGMIDDLCIVGRVMTATEILAVVASDAPVFAETSTFAFRPSAKGLVWGDDEGLWMRDTAGKPVLGVYGGEAATKNWGGFNLVPGDLLLGNNAVGSSAIWWSRVSGKFGFYGAGSGTPQVEIATDGSLTAGDTIIDSTGIDTAIGGSGISDLNSYRFSGTGVTAMGLYAYVDSGDQILTVGNASSNKDVITSVSASVSGYDASVKLIANGNAGQSEFRIYSSAAVGNKIEAIIDSIAFVGGNQFGITFNTDPIGFSGTAGSGYDFDKSVRAKTLYADGDDGGRVGTTAITNTYTASVSTGTGTVKLDGTTSRNSSAWIKVYIGATAYYLPAWTNIS